MTISDYIAAQLREALGAVNKWYCSQHCGREITDPEALLRYYIKHGGAAHFALIHGPGRFGTGNSPDRSAPSALTAAA